MVFALACSGIYKSEDSDFSNILNLESSACFSPFLSFFFFFFLSYYYYFTSDFTIIDLLFFKYSTISSLSMPSTCKFYKNSSNSASFPIPNAFLSFFFNFFYFFSYFWALFFFSFFRPFSDLSSSDDSMRAFLIYSWSSSEDDEDCGMARSSQSLTHRLLSSQFFKLLFFFLVTAASVYLLSSFLFRSASLIRNNLQQICDFLFNQELRFIITQYYRIRFVPLFAMENPSYLKNIPAQTKNNQTPTQQKEDGAKAQITLKNLPEKNINCLSKIPEVTEEYDLQGRTMRCQKKIKINKDQCSRNGSIGDQNKNNSNMVTNILSNIFRRSLNCIAFTYQKIYSQINSQEINVAQSQITEMLSKLRKKKQRKICLLPDLLSEDKKTLVLDLDQTLVNIGFKKPPFSDFEIQLQRKGEKVTMYIIKRFGLQSFLYQMSQRYEIVVFSSLKSDLVQKILSLIDPKKHISHFLSREHCIVINQCYFIKPVRDLGRNPKKVIVVDSHSIAGSLNPQNLYKIDRFKGSAKDRKLIKLGYFLKHIAQLPQIVPVDMYRKQFESKQILIYEKQNAEKYLRKKKTQQPQNLLQNSGQRSVETFVK